MSLDIWGGHATNRQHQTGAEVPRLAPNSHSPRRRPPNLTASYRSRPPCSFSALLWIFGADAQTRPRTPGHHAGGSRPLPSVPLDQLVSQSLSDSLAEPPAGLRVGAPRPRTSRSPVLFAASPARYFLPEPAASTQTR